MALPFSLTTESLQKKILLFEKKMKLNEADYNSKVKPSFFTD